MREYISIINEASDYQAFVRASRDPKNAYFHFTCPINRIKTVDKFLEKMEAEHGIIFCSGQSIIDKDYLIAGPKRVVAPLERMLHAWGIRQKGAKLTEPTLEPEKKGILDRILGR